MHRVPCTSTGRQDHWINCGTQLGAFVNETFQAREGLPPELFPEAIPTYLGHYHKPHLVGSTRVQYVGSPYEGTGFRLTSICDASFGGALTTLPAHR